MKSFDEIAKKAANGLALTPLETISLEGPCIDNQKRLNAFNRAIDDADQDLQALTATISAQGAELAEARELLKDALTTMEPDGNDTSYVHQDITAYLGDKS